MAAGGALCRYSPAESAQESGEGGALHERLVAYVQSLEHGRRSGVRGEHSYARERGVARGGAGGGGRARALLAPRPVSPAPAGDEPLDVDGPAPEPPRPPRLAPDPPRAPLEEEPADEEEWEARLAALAPSAAHARLAAGVADALRRMRLERLAGARGAARACGRRLRRALAPHWGAGGGARSPPAWLQAAVAGCVPRGARRLYEEAVGELRRAVPRLAERLTGAWSPPPPESAEARAAGPPVPASSEPWLVWVSSGCAALDARWERRLAALMHTRVLRVGRGPRASPDAWCAAAAGAVRDQLTDALAEAGDRGVILGGVGAGAALCVVVARGAGGAERAAGGVRGAVLVAPALRSAAGARHRRDEALRAVRLPLLLVVGGNAPDAPRDLAHCIAEAGGAEGRGSRRVLEVRGADACLRVPRRLRARLHLPQHALDAALVEECVRWAVETAEGGGDESSPPPPAPAPAPRRHPLPSIVHQIDLSAEAPLEEYAHLPTAAPAASIASAASVAPAASVASTAPASTRAVEILETRAAPSPQDIMQMPIVFADDSAPIAPPTAPITAPTTGTESSSTGSPVTVTSGKARGNTGPPVKMTRVILAKRGARPSAPPAPAPGGAGPAGARGAPRRLLVRRGGGMRLVARHDKA